MKDLFIIIWLRFQTQSSFLKTHFGLNDDAIILWNCTYLRPFVSTSLNDWFMKTIFFLSVACQKSSLYQHKQSKQILTGRWTHNIPKSPFFHTSWAFSHMIRLRPLAAQHLPLAQFGAHEISWGHRSSSQRRPVWRPGHLPSWGVRLVNFSRRAEESLLVQSATHTILLLDRTSCPPDKKLKSWYNFG